MRRAHIDPDPDHHSMTQNHPSPNYPTQCTRASSNSQGRQLTACEEFSASLFKLKPRFSIFTCIATVGSHFLGAAKELSLVPLGVKNWEAWQDRRQSCWCLPDGPEPQKIETKTLVMIVIIEWHIREPSCHFAVQNRAYDFCLQLSTETSLLIEEWPMELKYFAQMAWST